MKTVTKETILSLRNMLNHTLVLYGHHMTKFDRDNVVERLDRADKFLAANARRARR